MNELTREALRRELKQKTPLLIRLLRFLNEPVEW